MVRLEAIAFRYADDIAESLTGFLLNLGLLKFRPFCESVELVSMKIW